MKVLSEAELKLTSLVSEIKVDAVLREAQVGLEGILGRQSSDLGCGEPGSPLPLRATTGSVRCAVIRPGVTQVALAARLVIGNKEAVNINVNVKTSQSARF